MSDTYAFPLESWYPPTSSFVSLDHDSPLMVSRETVPHHLRLPTHSVPRDSPSPPRTVTSNRLRGISSPVVTTRDSQVLWNRSGSLSTASLPVPLVGHIGTCRFPCTIQTLGRLPRLDSPVPRPHSPFPVRAVQVGPVR